MVSEEATSATRAKHAYPGDRFQGRNHPTLSGGLSSLAFSGRPVLI